MTETAPNCTVPARNGWYWRQTRYDNYRLSGPRGEVHNFREYDSLYRWCCSRGVDATQA